MVKLPKRSVKFGVGKEIGGAVYVHCLYENVLPKQVKIAKELLPSGFTYTVVKFVMQSEKTSFIHCPDFDSADEPTVGESISIKKDGSIVRHNQPRDPFIYHHKWLFVQDDYSGFDVQDSRRRSELWTQLTDVDVKRIGRRSYWEQHIATRISESIEQWVRSEEACRKLRISACELSHRRNAGKIVFKKEGNTFYYEIGSQG